tara:strand:- start:817 stop:1152 length:336 start_codon:yes stop_codon:yes gene_type:complete
MGCKCKNIIENWKGGDVPLPTTFFSWVNFSGVTSFATTVNFSNGINLYDSCQQQQGKKLLEDFLTMGAHPSPVDWNDIYCIKKNMQVIHADEWIINGMIKLDGEAVVVSIT